jgi:UDP-N-acetylglucosamine 2-epimerase
LKLFFVLGTRPEAIKLAPLILCCRAAGHIDVTVCNTGQHKSLARDMLSAFGIEADVNLDVMRPGQTLTEITTNILRSIEGPLKDKKPDWVVVQGDTTTSFTAALAAFYQKIPVAHVEAGLRTGDRYSPWPEEINRRLNTALATTHFAPTERSRLNLIAEGIALDQITVTGNTGIDALLQAAKILDEDAGKSDAVIRNLVASGLTFVSAERRAKDVVIVTAHRRENFRAGIESICRSIVALAERYPQLKFVFPVHPNPEVTEPVDRIVRAAGLANIFLIEPLDYFPFAYLLRDARLVVSDSGGIQEEAVSLGKRLVVLRDTTERVELVGQPNVWIVGTDQRLIIEAVDKALNQTTDCKPLDIFGDGRASQRIVNALEAMR